MSLIGWVIGSLVVILIFAMLVGCFGVFFYDQASSGAKSVHSSLVQLKDGQKKF